ncbi:MAG: hypothetical protein JWN04_3894, partial [Myxococcaceae bacterium]|nr:hypothetical protein [Myxococcaceae bacterium]
CTLVVSCGSSSGGSSPAGSSDAAVRNVDAAAASGPTALTGTLGALGAIQPIVSSLVISNSGETLVYLSSGALTCDQLTTSRWLGGTAAGSQVVEIVVSGPAKLGAASDPEVNYAPGGKSSSYEENADTASVTFTKSEPMGVVEGFVDATYASPTGSLTGHFHAEYCANGQDY